MRLFFPTQNMRHDETLRERVRELTHRTVSNGRRDQARVLFLTDNPTLGGTIRILQSWLRLAASEGISPFVVTPPGSKFLSWLADNEIPATICPMTWPDRRWPVPALWQALRLAGWARYHEIDVIHCNEHNVYPFAALLRRLLPRPLVCHARYMIGADFGQWAFGRCRPDALFWTSRQQRQDSDQAVRGVVPEELHHILPLGLDLSEFGILTGGRDDTRNGWGFRPDEIVIGQACFLRPRKRIEEFVDLVAALAREDDRVVGVLAGDAFRGDEGYRERVLQHIKAANLGRRFQWIGNLDEIEPFYHGIDVFVSTSEYETFGNSVCEAMACKCPVIGYEGGSVSEVVGDAGLVVPNGDLPALISATRRLVASPELRAERGKRGWQRVAEHFNPKTSLHRLQAIYHQLLRSRLSEKGTLPNATQRAIRADDPAGASLKPRESSRNS
jgi:glycosyltransferase involved in cell wall biosynthesis